MLHLMQQMHLSNDKDTKYANQNNLNQKNTPTKIQWTPSKSKQYVNQNTKYAV